MAQSKKTIKVIKTKPILKRIKFLEDCLIDGDGKATFKAGEIKELIAPSANRWIKRSKAIPFSKQQEKAYVEALKEEEAAKKIAEKKDDGQDEKKGADESEKDPSSAGMEDTSASNSRKGPLTATD